MWESRTNGEKITIVGVKSNYYFYGFMSDGRLIIPNFCLHNLNLHSYYTYIGKAKGSISDLFEVEKQDKWNEKEYRKELFGEEK